MANATTPTYILPGSGQSYSNEVRNFSIAQQAFVAATRTLMVGTDVKIPARGMRAGDRYTAKFNLTKTAAGVATSTFDIATVPAATALTVGNATARVSFVKPAGTAAIDEGFVFIEATVRVVSATVGIIVGTFALTHVGNTVGHAQIPSVNLFATSGNFDNSTLGGGAIVVAQTTGAADVIVTELAEAQYVARTTTP